MKYIFQILILAVLAAYVYGDCSSLCYQKNPIAPCVNDTACLNPDTDKYRGLGCNADGVAQECRFCGWNVYKQINCPTMCHDWCNAANPLTPCFTDPRCLDILTDPYKGLGCAALNLDQCRFCGFGDFASIPCPK
eukprot:NODE_9791_length_564_cov_167.489796_g9153_i0.p1 GENE.NODE_9791_length_564_cov_167.489796_g9153_i0~~NODE_9791_length_564_cov_167.489796_g9153_i0.p1  ORF type:complete len:135 (-),score=16.48 NODE_9791_length_564_cov_167.489796_g9153_i0:101-505(-)